MKNRKSNYLYAFTLVIWLTMIGCDKGPHLTPITQEGKNTFSCKVNGKVWVPTGRGDIFVNIPPITGGFIRLSGTDSIGIFIDTFAGSGEDLAIYLNKSEEGLYVLNQNTSYTNFAPASYGLFSTELKNIFLTSANNTGIVSITKADTISGIIAGTFELTAADPKGNLVKITEGRFDIKSPL
ncbi:hypothetical protein CLV98_10552 [Dyadobacter jejuensis]|uniref:Uncharacterized protein n=1 Tax=Dyadobacter jejuensis TaxID=1082580 RepID=A0A316AK21_9BACT|nr:DUF6252 family protein [Dyadobacter jejuensis]PWJ57872.1 hypothetical protein CLV98_10552 [Dyadobacter jejuensis]